MFGRNVEEALGNLEMVFDRLSKAGLKLKAKKCNLFQRKVVFLGHVVSKEGIATDPEKIKVVQNWPVPQNVTEVKSFLGLCSYYRRYIHNFSTIARPLNRLTEKNRDFIWKEDCEFAFEELKKHLTSSPVLAHPDYSTPFLVDTDASGEGLRAVFAQVIDGKEQVISYASRSLTKSEKRYCVTRRKL
jgi:hypothetical protein